MPIGTYPSRVLNRRPGPHDTTSVVYAVLGGALSAWACAEVLLGLIPLVASSAAGVQFHVDDAVGTVAALGWLIGPVALLAAPTSAALVRHLARTPLARLVIHAAVGAAAALLLGVAVAVESGPAFGLAAVMGAASATVGGLVAQWASRGINRVAVLAVLAVGLWLGAVAATG